jgi:putative N6-adenine-specific DNA methylase
MIILSGWKGKSNFIDPMCGSGTIGIEAAMIGNNIAPNLNRRDFGFMRWSSFDKALFESVKNERSKEKTNFSYKIICNDINKSSINAARINAKKGGVSELIEFHNVDFMKFDPGLSEGTLMTNPPYGERMKQENVNEFYKRIGDTLKKNYKGLDAWILSSNKEAMKNIGLRTSRRITLFNGALECKFHNFKLYEGSRKRKYEEIN